MTDLRARVRDFAYKHVGGTALILIYHRVADLERDPQLLAVSPANFENQVKMLSEEYRVVPLEDLLASLRRRRVPDRAVVLTFDDGYADNLTTAEPMLSAHGVPATVFVSSGYVNAQREYWWDELERLVLCPGTLPPLIELETPNGCFSETLSEDLTYSAGHARRDAAWNVLATDANSRQVLYRHLAAFLRPLSTPDRETALEQLRRLARADGEAGDAWRAPRSTHRPLTAEEVATLDASPVVEVGAHTLDHPVLSALTLDEQRAEILGDRDAIAAMCGRPMRTFSYPYGDLDDYTDETVGIVRSSGFSGACANHLRVVKPWTDPFRLPRNIVRDWDAPTLAGRIETWFRERA
jgi:peptidoglycan/xylan/chitin deacetylase (PgdA/CDA1 family)